jgi:hypothetical protein
MIRISENIISNLVGIFVFDFYFLLSRPLGWSSSKSFYLAHHFAQIQEFDKAELCYLKAQCPGVCVEMYNRAAKWEQAFRKSD